MMRKAAVGQGMARGGAGRFGWAALALLVLLAAGCRRDPGGQLPDVGGEKLQAKREQVEGFALVRAWPDQVDGQLALALEFSRPLVGTQDFDALIRVEPAGADGSGWSLSGDGTTLRYPFVEPARDYTVTVAAGLLAADGSRLAQALKKTVHTGELDPVAGFASQGSVLPARESRGLPVVSVNVPEVDVEFLRVREDALPRFFARFQRGGRRGGWELDRDYGDASPLRELAESVYLNRFVLGGVRNERVLNYLPVQEIAELQQPGLYFAVLRRVGQFSDQYDTAFFTVSDVGLHARAYRDTLYVHTASLHDGAPLKGVELRVLDGNGEAVLKSATDGNGNALLDYRLDAGQVLVARRGKDVSLLPFNQPALDLSEFAVGGRAQADFDVFAWSGRDLYRPGETVRLSALLRDGDGRALPAAAGGKAGDGQPLFLRLKQPDGRVFRETRLEPGAQGYYAFEQAIPAEAPTGRWQVEFRTDPAGKDAVQGMTLRIEEFLPERLKLDLSTPKAQDTLKPGEALQLQADAAYLYGAPAAGNRFSAKLALAVARQPLSGSLPGFVFGDPTVTLPTEPRDVLDSEFDAQGRIEASLALPEEAAKAMTPVQVTVAGSVHESGGRPVSRSLQRVLWPAPALVGVRPLFDEEDGADANANARFELVRVDAQGRPQPAQGLKVTLVRELRDYHWRHDDGGWDYDFTRRFEDVETRTLDAGATAARFDFPVQWGEYRVDVFDPATGLTMRYPFRAGWSWGDDNRGPDARPDKVKLALDRTGYRAGDTLEVTVTPPHAGRGVLLVESDRLLHVQEIELRGQDGKASGRFTIPVTQDWERHDVYVTALVFRGGSAASQVTPARAVGVAHVPMRRDDRRVAVGLRFPAQSRPQQDLPVTVSAPQLAGRTAHVTVSATDVGILNITRFPVPDANAHFFAQRRLATDAYDVYGRVIESFEGGQARLRFGGDLALEALPQARRPTARVQTVDLFSGPVALDAQGNARLKLPLPDFNGTLRVSALVYSDDRYGKRDGEALVRAPVVAEAGMPRVMAPGDRGAVSLDVQNFSGKAGEFRVRVDGEGPLAVSGGEHRLRLDDGAKATLSFPLRAQPGNTVAKVRVRVDGGGYAVDRRYELPVRAAWPGVLRAEARRLADGAPLALDASLAEGLIPETVQARLRISASPPIPFASALQGLLDYPYGCAEQTTSKGYAALVMDADTAARLGAAGLDAAARRARMEGAFGRLAAMQTGSGHFSLWGGEADAEPALTPYIVDFLLDAREAGFAVPDGVLQKALDRLSEDLLAGGAQFYGRDHREHLRFANRAYAGYVLARLNRAPLGTLRALYDQEKGDSLTGLPLVQLGLALALQGDGKRGASAIADGFARDPDQRPQWLGDYGSRIRDDALMIALLHERERADAKYDARAVDLARVLRARRDEGGGRLWLSTQEQMALARLGKALDAGGGRTLAGRYLAAGETTVLEPTAVFARTLDHAALARGVRFEPQGGPYFASIEIAGIPRQVPAEDKRRVGIARDWFLPDGKPWTGGTLKEGQVLVVRLTLQAEQAMRDALVTDLLPAGLEAENLNLGDSAAWDGVQIEGVALSDRAGQAELRHEEYRDDRYVAALSLGQGATARLYYLVRAVTPGTYTVPPPQAEDMYQPTLRGTGAARPATITVTPP